MRVPCFNPCRRLRRKGYHRRRLVDSLARSVLAVNHRTTEDPACAAGGLSPLEVVMRYHQETKHHFPRYARALGYMDWANQPDPFRRYEGSPLIPLPVLKPDDAPRSPLYEDLYRPGAIASAPVSVRTLSRFLEYSLAISAWSRPVRSAGRFEPTHRAATCILPKPIC